MMTTYLESSAVSRTRSDAINLRRLAPKGLGTAWNRFIKTWICLTLLSALSLSASAGPTAEPHLAINYNAANIKFRNPDNEALVRIGQIWGIAEDAQGFMWFSGARGVARYDGLNVKIFQHDPEDDTSIPEGYISDILSASDGRIWVATQKGLYELLPETEHFIKRPLVFDGQEVIAIWSLAEHPSGRIWVGYTGEGVGEFDPVTGQFVRYFSDQRDANSSDLHNTYAMMVDRLGQVWWGNEYGLKRYNSATDTLTVFRSERDRPDSLTPGTVTALAEDAQGNVWIGTTGGLNRFAPAAGSFHRYLFDHHDPHSLAGNNIGDIAVDGGGNVWIASDGAGLNLYLPETDQFRRFAAREDRLGAIKTDSVRRLYVSQSGDLWLGYHPYGFAVSDRYGSSFQVFTHSAKDEQSLSSNSLYALYQSGPEDLWIATEKGPNHLHLPSGKVTRLTGVPGDEDFLSVNAALTILLDSSRRLWIGTWSGGLKMYDTGSGAHKHYRHDLDDKNSLPSDHVWIVKERNAQSLWVGTSAGLSIFDIESERFQKVAGFQHRVGNLASYDRDHLIVVADNGARVLNTETLQIGLISEGWEDIPRVINAHVNAKGEIWIGTEAGFKRQKSLQHPLLRFPEAGEYANRFYSQVLTDRNGVLWLGDSDGLASFDERTNKFTRFTSRHGLPGNSFRVPRAAIMLTDGRLAMGGAEGLVIFEPSATYNAFAPAVPVLTGLKVLDRAVSVGSDDSPIDKALNLADSVRLRYDQNVFSIEYSALDFQLAQLNTFKFKLEGFDPEWREVASQRVATYTNLNPGRYRFRVMASDDQGVWGQSEASVAVVILPPWWLTWWAYTLYILAALACLFWYAFSQWQKRHAVEQQNRLLEAKVAERTAEIQRKNSDIQAMLGSIQQGLFTIVRDGVIHPEYSGFLGRIYGTSDIAGRNATQFLFETSEIGPDLKSQTEEAVAAIVGEDAINFEFNSHLLIRSYRIGTGSETRSLELDWSPIVSGGEVEKLMVAVRDVTDIRRIEAEAQLQKKEVGIILQLLNVPAKRYLRFERSTLDFIGRNRRFIASAEALGEDLAAELLRNMHTIKGNARAFDFTYLGDAAHEAETRYRDLQQERLEPSHRAALLHDLDAIERELSTYSRIYRQVLGRGNSAQRGDGVWLDGERLHDLRASLERLERKLPELSRHRDFVPIQDFLSLALTLSFAQALEDSLASLPSLAKQLGKAPPQVILHLDGLYVDDKAADVLSDIFMHLFRNSLDHGIETPQEREQQGKSEVGTISIRAWHESPFVRVRMADDGRGLDLERLRAKSMEKGGSRDGGPLNPRALANLIFDAGISTKECLTQVSGRGMGMNAVKAFLADIGGDIAVKLMDDADERTRYVAFELELLIPSHYFIFKETASPAPPQGVAI